MRVFLEFMINFWSFWIVISILTGCYVSAVFSLAFLISSIIDLKYVIEQKEIEETIKDGLKLVDEVLWESKENKND